MATGLPAARGHCTIRWAAGRLSAELLRARGPEVIALLEAPRLGAA